jgi:hypothetical protein
MAQVSTPWYAVRVTYLALIALFLAAVLLQAYFAGRFIFGVAADNDLHASLGWPLSHGLAQLILLVSFFTRGGQRVWVTSIVWAVLVTVLPILAVLDEEGANAAEALHPLVAMVVLLLTAFLTWRAWALVAEGRASGGPANTASERGTQAP